MTRTATRRPMFDGELYFVPQADGTWHVNQSYEDLRPVDDYVLVMAADGSVVEWIDAGDGLPIPAPHGGDTIVDRAVDTVRAWNVMFDDE